MKNAAKRQEGEKIMKKLNFVKLVEELELFDELEKFNDLKKSELFKGEREGEEHTVFMTVYEPDLYMDYLVEISEELTPYYLGEIAIPAGMATSFQRSLGWNVAQKMATKMVSKIENDTISWEELVALSKLNMDDAFASLEIRRAITRWFSRNGENLLRIPGKISYVYPGSHWQLWPTKYDGSNKVVETYYSDFLYYDNSGKIDESYYYDCL